MANLSPAEQLKRALARVDKAKSDIADQRDRIIKIVGKAVLKEMETSPEYKAATQKMLRRVVTRSNEKADISTLLLVVPAPEVKPAANETTQARFT